jgi:hypothetical protein
MRRRAIHAQNALGLNREVDLMTQTTIRNHKGIPTVFLDGDPRPPIIAYVGPDYVDTFVNADVELYTFTVPGRWWVAPDEYDFSKVDAFIQAYVERIPGRYFMPRIYLGRQGFPWWGGRHPDEMIVVRDQESGEICDPLASDPKVVHYLGHEVRLDDINLHSFHSETWRREAGQAVSALIAHCEAAPYADQIWAWHLADGLFQEWFHWSEYAFGCLADYSPAAQAGFRRWVRVNYDDDLDALSEAWGRPMTWEEVSVPLPSVWKEPGHGEFYDPIEDRPVIDYMQCISDATVDSIAAICESVKGALPAPKATCVFYGYQFSDMPRPQLNGHYALRRLLQSSAVDMIASPHAYSNRGEGGYHAPQSMADTIRRAGKLHIDEIDCKTVWTPDSVTWKRHISQPESVAGTIEMMKKDAGYQLASGTAQWWMDLTNQGWFDAPEAVEPIRKLRSLEARLQERQRHHFGEIAFVVSQRAMMFQAPREGLHNAALLMFRNWHLSRMGAPFETMLLDDIACCNVPAYKLYIMANAFYLSTDERAMIDRVIKRNGATALWIYAPGYLNDRTASVEAMQTLTGIKMKREDVKGELNVALTDFEHPITRGLPKGYAYGTGIDREQYEQPPRIEYVPDTRVRPHFYADDPKAQVLGVTQPGDRPGLVLKSIGDYRAIYSAAPLLPWQLMRNIARHAGVHIYDDEGDMIWGNNAFLSIYAQHEGQRTIRFPYPVTVSDAYEGHVLGEAITSLDLQMARWESKLLTLEEPGG